MFCEVCHPHMFHKGMALVLHLQIYNQVLSCACNKIRPEVWVVVMLKSMSQIHIV